MITAGEFLLKGSIRQTEIIELRKLTGFDMIHKMQGTRLPLFSEVVYLIFQNYEFYELKPYTSFVKESELLFNIVKKVDTYLANEGKILKNIILDIGVSLSGKKFTLLFSGKFFSLKSMLEYVAKNLTPLVSKINDGDCLQIQYLAENEIQINVTDKYSGKRKLK